MNFKSLYLLGFGTGLLLSACGNSDSPPTSQPQTPLQSTPQTPAPAVRPVAAKNRGEMVFKKCRTCHTLKEGSVTRLDQIFMPLWGL